MMQKAKQEHDRHWSLQKAIQLVDQAKLRLNAEAGANEDDNEREDERYESTRTVLENTRRELAAQLESLNTQ